MWVGGWPLFYIPPRVSGGSFCSGMASLSLSLDGVRRGSNTKIILVHIQINSIIFCSVPAGGMIGDILQYPCRRNVRRFSAVTPQAECRMIFAASLQRNARRFCAVSLQAECSTIFCHVSIMFNLNPNLPKSARRWVGGFLPAQS